MTATADGSSIPEPASGISAVSDSSFAVEVLNNTGPVLVDFWAAWCGPCRAVAPVLDEIAAERAGRLTIAKLDVDANPETARDLGVVSIPTLILFRGGQPIKRIVGAKGKATLLRELDEALADPPDPSDPSDPSGPAGTSRPS